MIRWSEEEERVRPGLYVKTMELPPILEFLFHYVLCHLPVVRFLNLFGFSKTVSNQTAKLYETSSAFGIITIPSDSNEDFVRAGRVLERVWLTATSRGLSLQPLAAIPYLMQRIKAGKASDLSVAHRRRITDLDSRIRALGPIPSQKEMALIFRIGYSDSPSARSVKLPPVIYSEN
jgi:hypothetical protein